MDVPHSLSITGSLWQPNITWSESQNDLKKLVILISFDIWTYSEKYKLGINGTNIFDSQIMKKVPSVLKHILYIACSWFLKIALLAKASSSENFTDRKHSCCCAWNTDQSEETEYNFHIGPAVGDSDKWIMSVVHCGGYHFEFWGVFMLSLFEAYAVGLLFLSRHK